MEGSTEQMTLLEEAGCDLAAVRGALERLSQATLNVKQNIVWACAKAAGVGGLLQDDQVLLLRGMAEKLGCRLPVLRAGRLGSGRRRRNKNLPPPPATC